MAADSTGLHLFKTLLFTLVVPGTVTGLVPQLLVDSRLGSWTFEAGPWRWAGLGLLAPGVAALLWCAWDFATLGRGTPMPADPPRRLVTRGLYRHSRNPMYVAVLAILAGEALLRESWTVAAYAALVAALFHTFVVAWEEPRLRQVFRAEYEAYCRAVPRWLPRPGRRSHDPGS